MARRRAQASRRENTRTAATAMRSVLEREADRQIRLAEHQCRRCQCGQQAEGQQQRRQHLALLCGSARCLCIVRLIVSRGRPRSGLLWQFRRYGHDAVGKALRCANRRRRECAAYRARLLVERPRLSRGCKELDGGNTLIIGPAGQILPQPVDQVFECRNIHRARRIQPRRQGCHKAFAGRRKSISAAVASGPAWCSPGGYFFPNQAPTQGLSYTGETPSAGDSLPLGAQRPAADSSVLSSALALAALPAVASTNFQASRNSARLAMMRRKFSLACGRP